MFSSRFDCCVTNTIRSVYFRACTDGCSVSPRLSAQTQFCTGRQVWTSNIGISNASELEKREWNQFINARLAFEGSTTFTKKSGLETRRRRKPSHPPKIKPRGSQMTNGSTEPVRKSLLSGAVELSASSLLEWLAPREADDGDGAPTTQSLNGAKQAMSDLDNSLTHLQESTSFNAMQKTTLLVASALLDIAGRKECHNPFQCVQHAVVFASHGSKLGKSDLPFKRALPNNDMDCSPREALLVVGRADCLRALHFTDEAIFLCSYVLRICRLHHRPNGALTTSDKSTAIDISPRWEAVSAYAYMVSVAIDSTLTSLLGICGKTATASNWTAESLEDIKQGKADAIRIHGKGSLQEQSDENDTNLMNDLFAGPGESAVVSGEAVDEGSLNELVDASDLGQDEPFRQEYQEEEDQIAMVAV